MASAGMDAAKQDEHIQQLNNSLAAAFTAKAAVIPDDRLRELMERLETLEELLPDAADVEIDESWCWTCRATRARSWRWCSTAARCPRRRWWPGRASCRWAAGTCWTAAATAKPCSWPGTACASSCRCSSRRRGAACCSSSTGWRPYLQAGLMLPAQDEALTVRATRSALAKLDAVRVALMN
jgi:uncharacterized coiled-coil protein SlyX